MIDVASNGSQSPNVEVRKHSKTLTLRLTEEEREWLAALAEKSGLTQNDWMRQAIRKAAEKLQSK